MLHVRCSILFMHRKIRVIGAGWCFCSVDYLFGGRAVIAGNNLFLIGFNEINVSRKPIAPGWDDPVGVTRKTGGIHRNGPLKAEVTMHHTMAITGVILAGEPLIAHGGVGSRYSPCCRWPCGRICGNGSRRVREV